MKGNEKKNWFITNKTGKMITILFLALALSLCSCDVLPSLNFTSLGSFTVYGYVTQFAENRAVGYVAPPEYRSVIIANDVSNQRMFVNDGNTNTWFLNNGTYNIFLFDNASVCWFIDQTWSDEMFHLGGSRLMEDQESSMHRYVGLLRDNLYCDQVWTSVILLRKGTNRWLSWETQNPFKVNGFPLKASADYNFSAQINGDPDSSLFVFPSACYNPVPMSEGYCEKYMPTLEETAGW